MIGLLPRFVWVFITLSVTKALGEEYDSFTRNIMDGVEEAKQQTGVTDSTNISTWNVQPVGLDFPCELFDWDEPNPTNVNKVTPYDIKVIGALGDSITAGQGAGSSSVFTMTKQYRGLSFSVGGDQDLSKVTTVPNILRMYNKDLKGYSIKTGKEDSSNAKLNCAVSGSTSEGLYDEAVKLVDKISSDKSIDQDNDWKLISVFIGANDLCAYCKDTNRYSPDTFLANVKRALDHLTNLRNTIVNLILPIDVTRLHPLKDLWCNIIHLYACDCIMKESNREITSQASTEYQEKLGELIDEDKYFRDDFTVVIQPFFEGVDLPYKGDKPDKSYFAPDCFHFSSKSQAETAKALWNNMFEPVGNKDTGWQIGGTIKCPTKEFPYIYTSGNSDITMNNPSTSDHDNSGSHGYLAAIATSCAVGGVILVTLAVIVAVGIILFRKKSNSKTESIPLISAGSQI